MLYLSPYELVVIAVVFVAITFGPPLAGIVLAFARRLRGGPREDG